VPPPEEMPFEDYFNDGFHTDTVVSLPFIKKIILTFSIYTMVTFVQFSTFSENVHVLPLLKYFEHIPKVHIFQVLHFFM
jgi:hypothetical protein